MTYLIDLKRKPLVSCLLISRLARLSNNFGIAPALFDDGIVYLQSTVASWQDARIQAYVQELQEVGACHMESVG